MYQIPASTHQVELVVKKSRFISRVVNVIDRSTAIKCLADIRQDFPDASHHCWAYQLGPPNSPSSAAMSDDGEPGGTAGKPILNVLQHKGVGDVMVLVARYFGGIKLGAGGLVRAYSGAAQGVMENLPLITKSSLKRINLQINFSMEQNLRHWLAQNNGVVNQVCYSESVLCQISVPQEIVQYLLTHAAAKGWRIINN